MCKEHEVTEKEPAVGNEAPPLVSPPETGPAEVAPPFYTALKETGFKMLPEASRSRIGNRGGDKE